MIARILVLFVWAAGCDGTQPEAAATFEVDSLAPHCAETVCGLDRPLMRGGEYDLLVRFDDPAATVPFGAESSDRGVFVVTASEAHPPQDASDPLTHTVTIRTIGSGTATLRLLAEDGGTITSARVRVENPAAIAIELGPEAVMAADAVPEIEVGDTLLMIATATARDGGPMHTAPAVSWSTTEGAATFATDDGLASTVVEESVYLSALAEGTTTITATRGPTSATATIRIVPAD